MPKSILPRKTWFYTKDFKVKAVKLSFQEGIQVKQVAEGLDIHPMMLSRWRKAYLDGELTADGQRRVAVTKSKPKKIISISELTENEKLKKDNARLRKENSLLKKWQRYLAEQHQNDLDSSKDTEK